MRQIEKCAICGSALVVEDGKSRTATERLEACVPAGVQTDSDLRFLEDDNLKVIYVQHEVGGVACRLAELARNLRLLRGQFSMLTGAVRSVRSADDD